MTVKPSSLIIIALSLLTMLSAACGGSSAPTRFYILSPMAESGKEISRGGAAPSATVGIGPVELPAYLDRRQIVTRVSENELNVATFDEWGGTLKHNFTRILVENLHLLLARDAFEVFPFRGPSDIDYQVEVEVVRMDGSLGGKATLIARWSLFKRQGKKMLFTTQSRLQEPVAGPGYEALVAAQSRAVEALSREMAKVLHGIPRPGANP